MENLIQSLIMEAEDFRKRMHEIVDRETDELIDFIKLIRIDEESGELISDSMTSYERAPVRFDKPSAYFKSTKPAEVIFNDEQIVEVRTWREAARALLDDCNRQKHPELAKVCDLVNGPKRTILSSKSDGMNVPLKVDEEIYFEGFFATDTLLEVLKKRIFDTVGYDYSNIKIKLR